MAATLRQGDNGSWLGYPDDTHPLSARPTISTPPRKGAGSSTGDSDEAGGGGGGAAVLQSVKVINGAAALHLEGDPDPRLLKSINGTDTFITRAASSIPYQTRPSFIELSGIL